MDLLETATTECIAYPEIIAERNKRGRSKAHMKIYIIYEKVPVRISQGGLDLPRRV
jgi:hypothetical protein